MLVSKPTHGGGAPLGIDLEAGVATIRIPAKPVAVPESESSADSADQEQPTADPDDATAPST